MLKIVSAFVALLTLATVSACSNPGASLPPLERAPVSGYPLDSGDRIRVVVLGEPELSGEFVVDASGAISLPTLGRIEARNLTTQMLEDVIEEQLAQGQLRNPQVSAQVLIPRPFFILGEVAQPGAYPYVYDMSVLTAVAIAGGFTFRAQTDYVSITRTTAGEPVEGKAERNDLVRPGDVIYVFERIF